MHRINRMFRRRAVATDIGTESLCIASAANTNCMVDGNLKTGKTTNGFDGTNSRDIIMEALNLTNHEINGNDNANL